MPDDKTKVGEPDRSRVSADQDYEVRYFAEKHGLSPQQVRDAVLKRAGFDLTPRSLDYEIWCYGRKIARN